VVAAAKAGAATSLAPSGSSPMRDGTAASPPAGRGYTAGGSLVHWSATKRKTREGLPQLPAVKPPQILS